MFALFNINLRIIGYSYFYFIFTPILFFIKDILFNIKSMVIKKLLFSNSFYIVLILERLYHLENFNNSFIKHFLIIFIKELVHNYDLQMLLLMIGRIYFAKHNTCIFD